MRRWPLAFAPALSLVGCSFQPGALPGDGGADSAMQPDARPDAMHDGGGSGSGSGSGSSVIAGMHQLVASLGNAGELDNFRLAVGLDSSIVDYTKIPSPTGGLAFIDGNGDALAYEIEHWQPGGSSVVWVRVPALAGSGSSTTLELEWGQNLPDPGNLWTTAYPQGYAQVLHFDSGTAVTDSAGNSFPPTATGVSTATGIYGNGAGFTPTSTVTFSNSTSLYAAWSQITLQFWLNPSSVPSEAQVITRGGPISNGVLAPVDSGTALFELDWSFANGDDEMTIVTVPIQQWSLLTFTFDGKTLTPYLDGSAQAPLVVSATGTTLAHDSSPSDVVTLGSGFQGTLDELEVTQGVRSADWISAEYANATSASAVIFGP